MKKPDMSRLENKLNKQVVLRFRDGECAVVKLVSVAADEGEIVYELRTTDRPDRYGPDQLKATHLARIAEIAMVDDEPLSITTDDSTCHG